MNNLTLMLFFIWVGASSLYISRSGIATLKCKCIFNFVQFNSVHFSHSVVSDSLQPYGLQHARLPCLSPVPRARSNSVMPSNYLILCCPFFFLPSIFPSIKVFSNELVLHIRWPNYWSFSFSISPSNAYSGLIYFRIDWFDLLADWSNCQHPLDHWKSKRVPEKHLLLLYWLY